MNLKKNKSKYKDNIDTIYRKIKKEKLVLPVWQREFVWKLSQIERVFDSIYNKYPIGNLLIWNTNNDSDIFYSFLENINYKKKKSSDTNTREINPASKTDVSVVLDGQQRITSIINVLFYDKISKNNKNISLYFNVKKEKDCFKFLEIDKKTQFDFSVKDIYNNDIGNHTIKLLSTKERKKIKKLHKALRDFTFTYNDYKGDLRNALEVFRRVNTSGTPLTNPEINVSIIINEARKHNINFRDKINSKIIQIDNKYHIKLNLAFFIKAITVCILNEVKYSESKVENNIDSIIKNYKRLFKSIEKVSCYCDSHLCMSEVIESKNVLIPLVYYIYKYDNFPKGSGKGIKYYISLSSIYGFFGGQSDSVIAQMINYIDKYKKYSFIISNLQKITVKHVPLKATKKRIRNILLTQRYGTFSAKMVLYLIYSSINNQFVYGDKIQQDHMHPKKFFNFTEVNKSNDKYNILINKGLKRADIKKIINNKLWDKIPNLQLLTLPKNGMTEKQGMELDEWIKMNPKHNIDKSMPSKTKNIYKLNNFLSFYYKREDILTELLYNELH